MDTTSPTLHPSTNPQTALIEESAIARLLAYYTYALDSKRYDLFDAVFTPESHADYGPHMGLFTNREDLRVKIGDALKLVTTQHALSVPLITLQPPNASSNNDITKATALSNYTAIHFGTGANEKLVPLVAWGRYVDELEKGKDGWRIVKRTLESIGTPQGDMAVFFPSG